MIAPVKSYSCQVTGDGTSTSFSLDVSQLPFREDFAGALPASVLNPQITSTFTGNVAGITCELAGTTLTFTIPTAGAMPRLDNTDAVIMYTVSFTLQFAN